MSRTPVSFPAITAAVLTSGITTPAAEVSPSEAPSFGGTGLSNVTVTLSGAASATTTTDASGNYSLDIIGIKQG